MATDWLTRDEIDHVLDNLTGADILAGVSDDASTGALTAGRAFDAAAKRLGVSNGTSAMLHVRPVDSLHIARRLGELLDVNAPLPEQQEGSPDSASTGE